MGESQVSNVGQPPSNVAAKYQRPIYEVYFLLATQGLTITAACEKVEGISRKVWYDYHDQYPEWCKQIEERARGDALGAVKDYNLAMFLPKVQTGLVAEQVALEGFPGIIRRLVADALTTENPGERLRIARFLAECMRTGFTYSFRIQEPQTEKDAQRIERELLASPLSLLEIDDSDIVFPDGTNLSDKP